AAQQVRAARTHSRPFRVFGLGLLTHTGVFGRQVATFPNAATLLWILGWCSRHGKNPAEFYEQDYLARPRSWNLLAAFEMWQAEREEKQMEDARTRPPGSLPTFRR